MIAVVSVIHPGRCNGPPCTLCGLAATNGMLRRHWTRLLQITDAEAAVITPWYGEGRLPQFLKAPPPPVQLQPAGTWNGNCCGDPPAWPAPLIQPVIPRRVIRFDEHNLAPGQPGRRFNASLVRDERDESAWVMAYRDGWRGSNIHVAELAEDFTPIRTTRLDLRHAMAPYGREDPRLFIGAGIWYVSFIGVFGRERILHTNQLYARLSDDGRWAVERVYHPDYAARQDWEKNWLFYRHYAIYSLCPLVVLRIDGSTATLEHSHNWRPHWSGGLIRGGAPPVRVGDELYCFFHGRTEIRRGQRVYNTGLLTLDARPPFLPRRLTPNPFWVADPATKPIDQYAACVFIAGAVLHDGKWFLSAGIHDRHTEIAVYDFDQIEKLLEPV